MYSQPPVASQHKKTNKVVWTYEDDRPPKRTSTYERPFTQEGNYLVNWFNRFSMSQTVKISSLLISHLFSKKVAFQGYFSLGGYELALKRTVHSVQ